MNAVHLVGNIAQEIEFREFPGSKAGEEKYRATFLFAVDRPRTDGGTDFMDVVVWGVQAQNLIRFNGKGSRIGIDGHIKGELYQPEAVGKGPKPASQLRIEIVAERVEYLSAPRATVVEEAA